MNKENTISCHPERSEGSRFFGGQAPLRMTKQTNCHCERSVPQATPTGGPVRDERSEHAISYGLPRAHALAMTESGRSVFPCHPCAGGDLTGCLRNRFPVRRGMATEGGRSMVEMLGVLAIMGIVGMVGVKMYSVAMNKHKANELIYEAQKRATMVAMQITAGQENLSVANFTNPTGYTFGVEKNPNNANQFNITITGVDSKVCDQMKTAVGSGTTIRVISDNCAKLTFNNDLSKIAYASDNQTEATCIEAGFYWHNDDRCYASFCDTCRSNQACMTIDGTQKCITTCPNGVPLNADGSCPENKCSSNENCVAVNTYCKITSATYTGVAQACYTDLSGTCTNIGTVTPYDLDEEILGYPLRAYKSGNIAPIWWSANNWCKAQRKRLFSVDDLDCYNGQSHPSYESKFWCYAKGKGGGYEAPQENFPPLSQALKKAGISSYMWLATPSSVVNFGDDNGCYAHYGYQPHVSTGNGMYKRNSTVSYVYCRDP